MRVLACVIDMPIIVFIIIAVVIALMIYGHIQAKRRREEMQLIAANMGLHFIQVTTIS
jgi:hypothetical protein